MPWLTLLSILLSYFASRASGASATKSAITAGLVGGATYYTTHETEWGRANLGSLDGLGTVGTTAVTGVNGAAILGTDGQPLKTVVNGTADVLKSWGATGTAAVVATGAAAGAGLFSSDKLPLLIGLGLLAVFALKG